MVIHLFGFHQISSHDSWTSRYSSLAVHKDVSFFDVLSDELDGRIKEALDILLRIVTDEDTKVINFAI